jgi:hypothetical protein
MRGMIALTAALLAATLAPVPPAAPTAADPYLLAARNGDLVMTWLEPGAKKAAFKLARLHGGAWSPVRTIIAAPDLHVSWARVPCVAEDSEGVLYANWEQHGDAKAGISRDGGTTWSAPVALSKPGAAGEHGFVSLAALPHGGVEAVWLDGPEGTMTLHSAAIDKSGHVTEAKQVDARVCDCCPTAITASAAGPIVAYRDRSADEIRDISVIRLQNGSWSAPRTLGHDNWKIRGCPVNGPQLDARGNAVVAAWFTAANDKPHVRVAFSKDNGATFGAPIDADDGKPTGRVDVAFVSDDTAAVSWLEDGELRVRLVHARGTREPATRAGAAPARTTPRMAAVGSTVYVAWAEKGIRVAAVR